MKHNSSLYILTFSAILLILSIWHPAEAQQISKDILNELKENFIFDEIVEIAKKNVTQPELKKYLSERPDIYHFDGSEKQREMLVEGYQIKGKASIIGISFFSILENHRLAMINVVINPKEEKLIKSFIKQSFDSVAAPSMGSAKGGKLYWLGFYTLSLKKKLKIMLRSDTMPSGPVYSINFAIAEN
jgi:hypothetical protein